MTADDRNGLPAAAMLGLLRKRRTLQTQGSVPDRERFPPKLGRIGGDAGKASTSRTR